MTFGFTIYKFFQYMHEQNPERHPSTIVGAHAIGLLMVAIGVVTIALACWQHRQSMNRLRVHYPAIPFSPAYVLAALMCLLGILALIGPII